MPKGILNKASLVMVPEAPIDGTMPSVFPEDRSGDFTFTRGSNLAATRVASNGLIEKGRENLLLQSNQFDTTWTTASASVTSGQSGYDGSSDAWLLNTTGVGGYVIQSVSLTGVQTLSVYAKAGSNNFIRVQLNGAGADKRIDVNLIDGSTGTAGGGNITASTTSVGGGWWRIQVAANTTSTGARFYAIVADGDLSAGSGSIYIQDAQLESSMVATSYIESGATTGKAGLLENEPRIDFTGGGCGSLLLEPQRTNLVTNSEYFENYTKTDSSVMSNGATSPEGLENASKLFDGTGSTQHYIGDVGIGFFTNTDIRGTSVFVKAGTLDYMQLRITNLTGNFSYYYVNVNLNDGSVASIASGGTTNLSNSVEDYGNGWYRVSIACSFTNSNVTGSRTEIYTAKNNNHTYTGTGTDYILIYGAQSEAGSYPTSYIPTHGNIVTRSKDTTNVEDFSSFLTGEDVTYMFELKSNESLVRDDSSGNLIIQHDGGLANSFRVYRASSNSITTTIVWFDGDIANNPAAYVINSATPKVAIRRIYSTGAWDVFVDGVKTYSATNTNFLSFTRIHLQGAGTPQKFKQFVVFDTALTDEECSALTQP